MPSAWKTAVQTLNVLENYRYLTKAFMWEVRPECINSTCKTLTFGWRGLITSCFPEVQRTFSESGPQATEYTGVPVRNKENISDVFTDQIMHKLPQSLLTAPFKHTSKIQKQEKANLWISLVVRLLFGQIKTICFCSLTDPHIYTPSCFCFPLKHKTNLIDFFQDTAEQNKMRLFFSSLGCVS